MALQPAITDLEQLKDRPEVALLLARNPAIVTGAKFDRDQLIIWVDRVALRDACLTLKNDPTVAIQRAGRRHLPRLVSPRAALRSRLPAFLDN